MEGEIVNRVANSKLITLNLEDYYPLEGFVIIDLEEALFQGLILKEKEFRLWLKEKDWSVYKDKNVLIQCSADAIIPMWAYMLVSSKLESANFIGIGSEKENTQKLLLRNLEAAINPEEFQDALVVIKGCFDKEISTEAYIKATSILQAYARSIMYGEPCSTVPVYKKPKK